jgi:hypothetical protein
MVQPAESETDDNKSFINLNFLQKGVLTLVPDGTMLVK